MIHASPSPMEAALALAELGYAVFPCRPNLKRPATANGLLSATVDLQVIEHWWTQQPTANIALRTDGLLVVDRDPGSTWPGDPDRAIELSAAPTTATPRDGRHHFYRAPEGTDLRNTAGKIAPHVDTRANGGYVLYPPSAVQGKSYRSLTPLDCAPGELPLPAEWLLHSLNGHQSNGSAVSLTIPHTLATHPGAPEGERNQVLCHLVGAHLATHGATADLPQLAQDWSRRCRPPLPDAQVMKSVGALIRKHQASASAGGKAAPSPGTGWKLTRYSEVEPEQVKWLWRKRLPRGKLVILSGDPGLGKTTVLIDIAARVSTGAPFPDGSPCPLGQAIFYTLEDGLRDTMIPRLMAAGGNREHVIDAGPVTRPGGTEDIFQIDRDLPLLKAALEQIQNVLLIVIDPISGALGDSVNENKNADIRRVLGPLMKLAEETGACILGNSHFGKATDRKGVHRTIGSVGLIAAARAGWAVVPDSEDEERRLFLPQKNNLAKVDGLAFRLQPTTVEGCEVAFVEWEDAPVKDKLDDVDKGRSTPAFDEACDWLTATLTEPTPATEIRRRAKADGISDATLRRAKQSMGILSHRHGAEGERGGGEWHWFPPPTITIGAAGSFRF